MYHGLVYYLGVGERTETCMELTENRESTCCVSEKEAVDFVFYMCA